MLGKKSARIIHALAIAMAVIGGVPALKAALSVNRAVSKGDGSYYSISKSGGELGGGKILRATSSGMSVGEWSVVHEFDPATASSPSGIPIEGNDGYLYGTTSRGSLTLEDTVILGEATQIETYAPSVLYKVRPDGTGFSVIHQFSALQGYKPEGSLVEVMSLSGLRKLYGLAHTGGDFGGGSLFSINTDGTDFQVLHSFAGGTPHSGSLSKGPDNVLVGAVLNASGSSNGYIYWIYPNDESGLPVVFARYDLTAQQGLRNPVFTPVYDQSSSFFYVTCENGGDEQMGGILKIALPADPAGSLDDLISPFFSFNAAHGKPAGPVAIGGDGMGYILTQGTRSASNSGTAIQLNLQTGSAAEIYNFKSTNHSTILYPFGKLEITPEGQIIGAYRGELRAQGGIFQMDPAWTYHNRYQVVSIAPNNWTYAAALADAKSKGGHLATFGSAEEEAEALRQIAGSFVWNSYIGGTVIDVEGGWQWITGEPWAYVNWSSNEPNGGGNENYAEILPSTSAWNGIPDAKRPYYILEYEELNPTALVTGAGIKSVYQETGSGPFSEPASSQGGVSRSAGGAIKLLTSHGFIADLGGYADLPLDGYKLSIAFTDTQDQLVSSGVILSLADSANLPVTLQSVPPGTITISFQAGSNYRTLHQVLDRVAAEYSDTLALDEIKVEVQWGADQVSPIATTTDTLQLDFRDYAPYLAAVSDMSTTLPAGDWDATNLFPVIVDLDITDTDYIGDLTIGDLTVEVNSSNPSLLNDIQVSFDDQASIWKLTLNPQPDTIGSSQVGITVTDESGGQAVEFFDFVVQAGPRFEKVEIPGFIASGESAVFTILGAEGSGDLSFQWLKDGQDINGATESSYTIASAGNATSGRYSVKVSGAQGQIVSGEAFVQVIQSPAISSISKSQFVQPGVVAEITASFSGGGDVTAGWIFNGSPLQVEDPLKVSIPEFGFTNEGWYQLSVTNEVGAVSSPPIFLQQDLSQYEIQGVGDNGAEQIDFRKWSSVTDIAAGADFTIGLTVEGQILVSGNLLEFPGASKPIMDIAAGDKHAIALLSDGSLVGWGNNSQGQINFGSELKDIVQVVAGTGYTAVLNAQGEVALFGSLSGETGVAFKKLVAGSQVLAGITESNTAEIIAGSAASLTPFPATLPADIMGLALGNKFGVAVASNGDLLAWGDDARFGLSELPFPDQLSSLRGIDAGLYHAALINQDGVIFTWGAGSDATQTWPHFGQAVINKTWNAQRVAVGSFHSAFLVYIPVAPEITTPLSGLSELVGSTLRMEVEYTGDGPVVIQWEKSASVAGPWTVIQGETEAILEFPRLQGEDTGYYRVTLTNNIGSVNSVALLTALMPPVLVDNYQPAEITEPVGATGVTLDAAASVTGSGPFKYQWFLNDDAIQDATLPTFKISELLADDSGTYSVRVTGPGGEQLFTIGTVTAIAPPALVEISSDLTLKVGDTAEFSVTAEGSGQLSYAWFKADQAALVPLGNQTQSTMTLPSVDLPDAGDYVVRVTNAGGSVQSDPISLSVLLIPGIQFVAVYEVTKDAAGNEVEGLISDPAATPVAPGSRIRFKVNATGSDLLEYTWFKDGRSIPGSNSAVVEIFEVSRGGSERGKYHVRVENQTGAEDAVESAPIFIETQTAPQILSMDIPASVIAPGRTIEILSLAVGYNLSYQWKKDRKIVGENSARLEILQAQSGDSGNYQLEVTNKFGSVTSELIAVQVKGLAPVISQQPVGSIVPIGGTIELTVGAMHTAGETLNYRWYKDGNRIEAAGANLMIEDATESDMGSYQVVVSSQSGAVFSNIVEIESPTLPKILRHPEASNVVVGQSVNLSVDVESDQRSGQVTYQWYQNSVPIPEATSATLSQIIASVEGVEEGADVGVLPTSGVYYKPGEGIFLIYVEVTNDAGKVLSGVATIVVADDLKDLAESGEVEEIQTFALQPGWNAIYLKVQPENAYIEDVLADIPWTSVWRFKNRRGVAQFIEDLSESDWDNPEWLVRFSPNDDESGDPNPHVFANDLIKFRSDNAYLIHISEEVNLSYTLNVKGVVAPSSAPWVTDSYNLRGFPISNQSVTTRDLFQLDPALWDTANDEPEAMYRLTSAGLWARMTGDDTIISNEAYWIYSNGAVQKAYPIQVTLDFGDTMKFDANLDERHITLINHTNADRMIFFTMGPAGVQEITPFELGVDAADYVAPVEADANPDLNETPGLRNISPISVYLPTLEGKGLQPVSLNNFNQIKLAGGEERTLTFKVNREMIPAQGWENKLYITDRLVVEKIAMEVTPRSQVGTDPAIVLLNGQESLGSSAAASMPAGMNPYQLASLSSSSGNPLLKGLWFGQITINAVSQVNGYDVIRNERSIINSLGEVTNIVEITYKAQNGKTSPTVTSAPLDVNMLVHHNGSKSVLLSEVFFMREPSTGDTVGEFRLISNRNLIGNYEGVSLQGRQKVGRRISSIAFPLPKPDRARGYSTFDGSMAPGQSMKINLSMDSNDPLNPYKHKYHPDHDNLSANFKTFSEEAYPILRTIELTFNADGLAQDSKSGTETMTGVFEEEINYLHRNPIVLKGTVEWIRISPLENIISE